MPPLDSPNAPNYPFPRLDYGGMREVAPGIHWVRMALPFALNHINLWLLEDGDGWTLIDTGYNSEETRAYWEAIFAEKLDGRPIRRLIVTHFHPDHIALASWHTERWNAPLWITYSEWLQAQLNAAGGVTADLDHRLNFYRDNGLDDEAVEGYRKERPDFARIILAPPANIRRLMHGETFPIYGRDWQVITSGGHSPEHACLWCREANVLISGDQVLPRITTNISLMHNEPDGDPLRLYLESFNAFRELPADTLVLPSHDRPFYGLHDRLDTLDTHHAERLDAAWASCAEPATAVDMIPALFTRKIDGHQMGFAIGETLSHANYLVTEGRLVRETGANGMIRYRQT